MRQAADGQTAQTLSVTASPPGTPLDSTINPVTKQQQQEGVEGVPVDRGDVTRSVDEELRREKKKSEEQEKELSLLRNLVEKLQREVEGLKHDKQVNLE